MATGRAAGIGVLAGAVVLLAVIAGQSPRTAGGTAVAAPIPGPPTVGQCLLAAPGSAELLLDDQGLRSTGRELATCPAADDTWTARSVVLGEVAAVLTERLGRPQDGCVQPVADFLGEPPPRVAGAWITAGGPRVLVVNPDRRQWADGQRWQACVLLPPLWTADGLLDPARGIGPVLRESARGRWSDPTFRNRLGDCVDEYSGAVATLYAPVFCGRGHELERLGVIVGAVDPRAAAVLRQSCGDLASARTAAADPTFGGRLRILVVVTAADGTSREIGDDAEELPGAVAADCLVRPTDPTTLLTASVIGLGAGPVPLGPR